MRDASIFAKVVERCRTLVDIDKSTENMNKINFARILVQTSTGMHMYFAQGVDLMNDGVLYKVKMVEEIGGTIMCRCNEWKFRKPNTRVSSIANDMGMHVQSIFSEFNREVDVAMAEVV